jgi:DNA repair protein RadC
MEAITIGTAIKEVQIKYITRQKIGETRRISNSREVFEIFYPILNAERVEVFICVMLTTKNRVLAYEVVSRGSLNESVVHPREVFSSPVRLQAAAVLFLHNHPSGDPTPSQADQDCTQKLMASAKTLQFRVLDHIIIGESDYYSFADAGKMPS